MQALMETLFDVLYLFTVTFMGIKMISIGKKNKEIKLFGIMAVILGVGDSFHLIPRAYALWTNGLEANAPALGFGKFTTSITMTIFYIFLFVIWKEHYKIKRVSVLDYLFYGLAFLRIILCFFPQNEWFIYHSSLNWAIYRNIPFAIIGIFIMIIYYVEAKKTDDKKYKYMWLAVFLSFLFYVPVVLFSDIIPIIGILMIPKTLAYVWIIFMGKN